MADEQPVFLPKRRFKKGRTLGGITGNRCLQRGEITTWLVLVPMLALKLHSTSSTLEQARKGVDKLTKIGLTPPELPYVDYLPMKNITLNKCIVYFNALFIIGSILYIYIMHSLTALFARSDDVDIGHIIAPEGASFVIKNSEVRMLSPIFANDKFYNITQESSDTLLAQKILWIASLAILACTTLLLLRIQKSITK